MEQRKYALVSYTTDKAQSRMNRSASSDGSPTSVKRKDRASMTSSKEAIKAFKKRKSNSLPTEAAVFSRSDSVDSGSSAGGTSRPRLVSEDQEYVHVDRSTIELLQNLTSIIVCTRNTFPIPHTASTDSHATTTTAGGLFQNDPPTTTTNQPRPKLEHQSISSSDYQDCSHHSAGIVESMNNAPMPDNVAVDNSPSGDDDLLGFQEPLNRGAQTLDITTHPTLSGHNQATDEVESNTLKESTESQMNKFSSSMVSSDDKSDTALVFSKCDSGSDVDIVSQIQGLVNTITKSNKLESSYSDLCVTDKLEQTQANEAEISKSTATCTDNLSNEAGAARAKSSRHQPQLIPQTTPQEFNLERPQEFKQRSEPAPLECSHSWERNKELCCTAAPATPAALSLFDSKERSGKAEASLASSTVSECLESYMYKEVCFTTATAPVPAALSLPNEVPLTSGTVPECCSESYLYKELCASAPAGSLFKSESKEGSGRVEVLLASSTLPEYCSESYTYKELDSTASAGALRSLSDSKERLNKTEVSLTSGTVPKQCAQPQLMTGSGSASSLTEFRVVQEIQKEMPRHQTATTKKQSMGGDSCDNDTNDSRSKSDARLQMQSALSASHSNENDKTDLTTRECRSSDQQDTTGRSNEPSQRKQKDKEREASLSDSEVTLSAPSSDREEQGEGSKKNTTSFLRGKRRKKRLHSNPKRRSSKGRDVRMSGAPGPSCASERLSHEVAMRATQARKLLAKSKATVSLRQRQKSREAERSAVSASEDSRRGSRSSSLRRIGEEENLSWQESNQREGVRKSQRVVKGKRILYVSEDEPSDEEEFSPTSAKRRKRSSPRRTQPSGSQSHALPPHDAPASQPLMGDFLATILTDIPEVDIRSLSSLSANTPFTSHMDTSVDGTASKRHQQKSRGPDISSSRTKSPRTTKHRTHARRSSLERVAESPKHSPRQTTDKRRGVLPRLYNRQSRDRSASSISNCPSPEVGLQNKNNSRGRRSTSVASLVPLDDRVLQDSEESRTHFRVLMSWETDYLRGSMATRGPILYAMEKVREQLDAIEGPWMNKAKFIWTTWRHKVSPKVRSIYTKKAKENRKELYGRNKVVLNIRRPPPKVSTIQRQSVRNITKTAPQQKKQRDQDKLRHRSQSKATATRKQHRKQQNSVNSGRKNKSKLSTANLAPSSEVGVDTLSSGIKDESEDTDKEVLDHKAGDKATRTSTGLSSQELTPAFATSKPKLNTATQSRRDHTPLLDQQTPLSSVDSVKDKSMSNSTTSSPTSVTPPPPLPPVITVSTKSQTRQSIQFTEKSLKVSFRRTPSSSPPTTPFVLGTTLDASSSFTTATMEVKQNSSKMTTSDSSSAESSSMPSSQQLAKFFSSMTPLPAPVSPKGKQQPSDDLSSTNANSQLVPPPPINTPNATTLLPLPPRSNVNVIAPTNSTSTSLLSHSSANSTLNVIDMPPIPHSGANHTFSVTNVPLILHSGANITPNLINSLPTSSSGANPACSVTNTPLILHSGATNSSFNTTNTLFSLQSDANANTSTMINTPLIPRSNANYNSPITTNNSLFPTSDATIGTPNSSTTPLIANLTASSSSSNTTSSLSLYVSSSPAQCSITTQARSTTDPPLTSMSVAQSEPRPSNRKNKPKPPKPTYSSIYQQLVADKKIKPSKSASKKPSKSPKKKKFTPSLQRASPTTVLGGGGTKLKSLAFSDKGTKRSSPKQGLSSRLSSPLCTTFPTFVIPQMPMGGSGTDPNLLVSPVWLGPGSFSGLMSTVPYQAPPTATPTNGSGTTGMVPYQAPPTGSTGMVPYQAPPTAPPTNSSGNTGMDIAWSKGPSSSSLLSQVLPTSTSSSSLKLNNFSSTSVTSQTAYKQPSPFGFSSSQFGSFHSSNYSGLPAFPVELQLKPANNSEVSGSDSVDQSLLQASTVSKTTATKGANDEKQKAMAKGRKRPSKLITSTSKATKKGSGPSSHTNSKKSSSPSIQTASTISSSPESSRPHIDMYPDSPPASKQQTGKTLQYHPLNESPRNSVWKSPNTPHTLYSHTQTTPSTSSTPMSPPTHMPTNKSGRFRFPSSPSPFTLPSSLPSTPFTSLSTMLKSPTSISTTTYSTLSPTMTTPTTPSNPSLTTLPGVTASSTTVSSSSTNKVQDVNSLEYRKLILKRVQQWNEHKMKLMQGRTDRMKLKSPPMFSDGPVQSPTSGDNAHPVRSFGSTILSPTLRTALVSSSSDTPAGLYSSFKVTSNPSREGSPTSMIQGLGSPKLLTVGPPITFADTLVTRTTCSSSTPSSLELKSPTLTCSSVTTPGPTTLPSVASSAVRMDDILTASYGCSMVAPSIVFNSSFMGDISSMSRWELEQLYQHNMEKLEQQKKFISILEAQLKRVREQHVNFATQKPSQSELYQRFLSFIVEPEVIPDVSTICSNKFGYGHLVRQTNGAKNTKPTLDLNEVVKGGTFDRPVLNEKYDFYANFGRS